MHDRLRMYDDFDTIQRQLEEMMSLDEFEPFIHHGCRIDRNLGSHAPIRMGDSLLRCDLPHVLEASLTERPAAGRQNNPFDCIDAGEIEALPDRIVLTVDR